MQIPPDAIIPIEKLTSYLLVPRLMDDKSKFLAQAGFSNANFRDLEVAIRTLAAEQNSVNDGVNDFGAFYRQDGSLLGPNRVSLPVTVIWLQWRIDGVFHFVTLKPRRAEP